MRGLEDVAQELAMAHRRSDQQTTIIKLFPAAGSDEIWLLEVSKMAPTTGEVLPFKFAPDRANHIDYPSVVILLSPEEWEQVQTGRLDLPPGWDIQAAQDL